MDVAAIALADVLRAIEPNWTTKTITIDRTRSRIEAVLDWCVVRGHRPPGTNPAKWKGHLDQVLPAVRKVAPRGHHAALPYAQLPAFMVELRGGEEGIAARALEFIILTAARTGEALGAIWNEIDLGAATWTVPAERMKAKRQHMVPLSPAAHDLLRKLPREEGNPHVFIGSTGGHLGDMTLQRLLKRLGRSDITVHGFRSTFSDWSHEQTAHSTHTIEISLAHAVGNDVEKAYRRGPMLQKRVRLMDDWAKFATSPPAARTKGGAEVVPIGGGR
jgi:integrase